MKFEVEHADPSCDTELHNSKVQTVGNQTSFQPKNKNWVQNIEVLRISKFTRETDLTLYSTLYEISHLTAHRKIRFLDKKHSFRVFFTPFDHFQSCFMHIRFIISHLPNGGRLQPITDVF